MAVATEITMSVVIFIIMVNCSFLKALLKKSPPMILFPLIFSSPGKRDNCAPKVVLVSKVFGPDLPD
jgi:hypothetical protein